MQNSDADKPKTDAEPARDALSPAEQVITKFGGIRPMAAKLGVAVTTVQGWKERGSIPPRRRPEILAAAAAAGIPLEPSEFGADEEHPQPDETIDAEPIADPRVTPGASESGPWRAASDAAANGSEKPAIDMPKQRRGFARGLAWALVALVLIGAAAAGAWWYAQQAGPNAAIADLAARMDAAEGRLATLPDIEAAAKTAGERAAGAAAATERLEAAQREVEQRLKAIEERLASAGGGTAEGGDGGAAAQAALDEASKAIEASRAETREAMTALREELTKTIDTAREEMRADVRSELTNIATDTKAETAASLEAMRAETARVAVALEDATKRLAALEAERAKASAGGARLAARVAAIGQLREAVRAGRPFAAELQAVRALNAEDQSPPPQLQTLSSRAEMGVASIEALRARFGGVAGDVVRAAGQPVDGSWLDRALWHVSTIVTVRRTGGTLEGDDAESIVGRAERQLAAGDLKSAVATVGALTGSAAEAAAKWLADARAALEADAALQELQDETTARLAVIGGAVPPAATPAAPK